MPDSIMQQALEAAVVHHQAGRLDQAASIYRQSLVVEPNNPDALHLLGMVDCAQGRHGEGIALMQRAIAACKGDPPPHFHGNLADGLRETGRTSEAEGEYRRAIARGGRTPEIYNNLGITLLQLGRDDEAAAAFEESLHRRPGHPGAAANLAGVMVRMGRAGEALAYADAAIVGSPGHFGIRLARAGVLRSVGRYDDAMADYRAVLAGDSRGHVGAWMGLADALREAGQAGEAAEASQRAISLAPEDHIAWTNHGANLSAQGKQDDAAEEFERACELAPGFAVAHANLGAALLELGRPAEAIESLRKATELDDRNSTAFRNLSTALCRVDRFQEGIDAAMHAVEVAPRDPAAHNTLGAALWARGRPEDSDQAAAAFSEAVRLDPEFTDAWTNLGVGFERAANAPEALAAYDRALARHPDRSQARVNRSFMLLLTGDWERGWPEHEWRLAYASAHGSGREYDAPRWRRGAKSPSGGLPRVVVYMEQGLGDAVHFASYVPLLKRETSRVILHCVPEIASVLRSVVGVDEVVSFNEPLPEHDFAVPSMSLAMEFVTTLASVPAASGCAFPYIHADMVRSAHWRARMHDPAGLVKVGLVWSGSPKHSNDRNRSIALRSLLPLATTDGVRFYSLQKGPASGQVQEVAPWPITDLSPMIESFDDTAAILDSLDLLISVDTSVCHLAGAMARPVWLLLPSPPDWRWLLGRDDTPWYPTMRLYRQTTPRVWSDVIARVAEDLKAFVDQRIESQPAKASGAT